MTIFSYTDYRKFAKDMIQRKNNGGRGEIARMAQFLHIHSTLMSLILSGKREMTMEQSYLACDYWGLTEKERDFFMILVQFEKAGHSKLKAYYREKIEDLRRESDLLSAHVEKAKHLSDTDRAIFYSSWIYSAVRLFCSTDPQGKSIDEIAERFSLPRKQSLEIVKFLVKTSLLRESHGRFLLGERKTFLEFGSPFLTKHHLNWRLKAMQRTDDLSEKELMVTSPFSVSQKDFQKIKNLLIEFVQKSSEIIKNSEGEEIACFNLDLFWIR